MSNRFVARTAPSPIANRRLRRATGWIVALVVGGYTLALATASQATFSSSVSSSAASAATKALVAPSPVTCQWTGANSLSLAWTNTSTWAAGYDYERSNTSGAGFSVLGSTVGAASTSGNDANPLPTTLRYYRVRSKFGTNWTSAYTAETVSNTCDGTIVTVISGTTNGPSGVAADASGNVYTSDQLNHRILKTTSGGTTTTVVGTGVAGYSGDGGAATAAKINTPKQIALDSSGNLYIADSLNSVIRKVTAGGTISTVAGTGSAGFSGDGGAATSAQLNVPQGVYVDASGNIYIADTSNSRIRKVTAGGTITTIAGSALAGYSGDGGAATSAKLDNPYSAIIDTSGNVFIADTNNEVIRKVTAGGTISTIAGGGATTSCSYNGAASGVSMLQPKRLAYDSTGNRVFIPDADRDCVRVLSGSTISPVAGTGTAGYSGDNGPAISAKMDGPVALGFAPTGDLYVAESLNNATRRILQP